MSRAPWAHRKCASHVAVDGAGRVCVLPGQSEAGVVDFAEQMAGAAAAAGRRLLRPGAARVAPSAERLRHASCLEHVDGRRWGLGRLCVARGSRPADVVAFAVELQGLGYELRRSIRARVATSRELAAAGAWTAEPDRVSTGAPLAEWAVA